MKFTIAAQAQAEFAKEVKYSSLHWGAKHAKKYKHELESKMRGLIKAPYLYPVCKELEGTAIRAFTHKGHRVFYSVNENPKSLLIIAIISIHQQTPENLSSRIH